MTKKETEVLKKYRLGTRVAGIKEYEGDKIIGLKGTVVAYDNDAKSLQIQFDKAIKNSGMVYSHAKKGYGIEIGLYEIADHVKTIDEPRRPVVVKTLNDQYDVGKSHELGIEIGCQFVLWDWIEALLAMKPKQKEKANV